ncbi:hypothetical protein PLIIFM63780_010560 [Purpureocillium lilacinum]|nr:hypothetical protein PLIIFM63780_010560 [Purpureocillium lilacinum]
MAPVQVMEAAPGRHRIEFERIQGIDNTRTRLIEELLDDLDRKEAALKKAELDLEKEQEVRRRLQQDALGAAVRKQAHSTSSKPAVIADTEQCPTSPKTVNRLVQPERLGPVLRDDAGNRYDYQMEMGRESGHDLLIDLANDHDRAFIARYIRTKLTDDEARILHSYLRRNPQKISEFIDGIPTDQQNRSTRRWAKGGTVLSTTATGGLLLGPLGAIAAFAAGAAGGPAAVDSVADEAQDQAADKSKALKLAGEIWDEWWERAVTFEPRPVAEVITLLERIQDDWTADSTDGGEVGGSNRVLDGLRRYIYGRTPLRRALCAALEAFPETKGTNRATFARTLLVISDGFSTDGDPRMVRDLLLAKKANLAAVYLTDDSEEAQRRLYDDAPEGSNRGQRMLFDLATKIPPGSLTFLNSWGIERGDKGQFSIEDSSVLQCDGHKVLFYDVEWKLEDLAQEDKDAFDRFADDGVRKGAERVPSVFELEILCPLCKESATIASFTGSLRRAFCPGCKGSFKPEPGYLAQALYARAGL